MRFLTAAAVFAALSLAGAAQADPTTFAQFNQIGTPDTIRVTNGAGSTGTISTVGAPTVVFDFLLPDVIAAGYGSQNAIFSLTGTISQPASVITQPGPDPVFQLIDSGSISFTRTVAAAPGTALRSGTNLLTIQFTNALLTGFLGGTSGSVLASTPDSALYFTSDFLDFSGVNSLDFALALSSITGGLGRDSLGDSVRAFTSDSTGTFSTDPTPTRAMPEPGVLGLLGLGFAGLALSRRRRKAA